MMNSEWFRTPVSGDPLVPELRADRFPFLEDVPAVDSWPTRGTMRPRSLRPPQDRRPTGQDHDQAAEGTRAQSRPGVLVVDDNEGVRTLLQWGLERAGFAVWLADNGWRGYKMYRKHQADIDVVLLDVAMPDWSGPVTLFALQQLNPSVRFCFMSGDPGPYTETGLMEMGALAFIAKPFQLGDLVLLLQTLLPCPARTSA